MNSKHFCWRMLSIALVLGMIVASFSQGVVFAQEDRPEPAAPFGEEMPTGGEGLSVMSIASASATGSIQTALQTGGKRLVDTQNPDGGWAWPLTGPSTLNTVGPIAMGLAQAYHHTASTVQKAALKKAGDLLLTKTNNFSPPDGYLAVKLDQVFGGNLYTNHVMTNFYAPLAAGTYNHNGAGTLYTTASYVASIQSKRTGNNLAAWDLGMGLVAAKMIGASTTDWIAGVEAEINEMDVNLEYDVIGLAGALYGLAFADVEFDPTAGQHAAAGSLDDLADILASYQIDNGGFAWNANYVIENDGNETIQETAYALLALNEVDRAGFLANIQGAADYLVSVQLGTGGWINYVGNTLGENNEVTGEALWAISVGFPEVWVCKSGNCGHPGLSFNVIQQAVDAVDVGGIVHVLPGTYYENQITLSKPVSVSGAGPSLVTLDGGDATLASPGLVRILADGDVTFSGFTLKNGGKTSGLVRMGIFAQSTTPGITFTIANNVIYGSNNDAEEEDYGFYSQGNAADLVFTRNRIFETGSNNMVLEKHSGASEVSFNQLNCGVGADAFFAMTYGGLDVTKPQKIHHNTIDLGTSGPDNCTGIAFASAYRKSPAADLGHGKYTALEIKDNKIVNVKANRRGISLWNGDDGDGTGGDISGAVISGNHITGIDPVGAGSKGIQLINLVSGTDIRNNVITKVVNPFHGRIFGPGTVFPSGTTITRNSFTASTLFLWDDPVNTLSAELNWWGSTTGPTHATNPGGTGIAVSDRVDFDPWAKAYLAAQAASTHEIGELTTLESNIAVEGLYGAQLRLGHDAGVLTWQSGTANDVTAATPPWEWDIVQENFVSVTGGRRLSGSMQAPDHTVGANLTGQSIATWRYTCSAVGASNLEYNTDPDFGTLLSDINGFEIPLAFSGDWVDCLAATASVEGTISLQGRLSTSPSPRGWNGAEVTLTCVSSECDGFGPYTMVTDSTGHYSLAKTDPGDGVALGTYVASVARRAYLGATKANYVTIASGSNVINTPANAPMLLGGDVNDDGVIGLGDLTSVAGNFGNSITADTLQDINGDAAVNIFDLVLVGGNYNQVASTWSP